MRWRDDRWNQNHATDEVVHVKAHEAQEGSMIDPSNFDIIIPHEHIPSLVEYLIKNGYVRPLINNESRQEDLKIIHRLLDNLNK